MPANNNNNLCNVWHITQPYTRTVMPTCIRLALSWSKDFRPSTANNERHTVAYKRTNERTN